MSVRRGHELAAKILEEKDKLRVGTPGPSSIPGRASTPVLTLDGDPLTKAEAHRKVADHEVFVMDPDLKAEIDEFVEQVNSSGSRAEHARNHQHRRPRRHDRRVEMTPTLKIKRTILNTMSLRRDRDVSGGLRSERGLE